MGSELPDQGLNCDPCRGSVESKPLAHQRSLIIHVGIFVVALGGVFVVVPHGFILASIFILVYFLAMLHGMRDLSSPAKDCAP